MLALPLVIVVQFVFTLGFGLLIANTNVFIRDVSQLWRIMTMAWMFLTPVFWKTDLMLQTLGDGLLTTVLFNANPAFPLIQAHRIALGAPYVDPAEFWGHLARATIWAVAFLLIGYSSFVSSKHKYADLI
jgi:ABC-type polysaccharide/polyol phosphate export permease